jgi:ribose 5-phosphate isomerase B
MHIAVGNDHRGLPLKQQLIPWLEQQGHTVVDLGTAGSESVDYPDYAGAVAREVAAGRADRGLLMCGTGIGMAIAANKVAGVRATIVVDEDQAEMCRRHNDVNILCLGEKQAADGLAQRLVARFLATPFEAGRHAVRVGKMMALGQAPPTGGCG